MLTVPGVTGGIITLLVLLGLLLGLAFGGSEFLNPSRTALDTAKGQYELDRLKQLGGIEVAEAQRHAQRRLTFEDRALAIVEDVARPAIGVVVMSIFLLAIGGMVLLVCHGLAALRSSGPPPPPAGGGPPPMTTSPLPPMTQRLPGPPGGATSVARPPQPPQRVAAASPNGSRPTVNSQPQN